MLEINVKRKNFQSLKAQTIIPTVVGLKQDIALL